MKHARAVALAALTALVAACGGPSGKTLEASTQKPALTNKTLYERLGGLDAITVVVNEFVANLIANPMINTRFANTDVPAFKQKLVDQICEASGGPCKYTGKDMIASHTGMAISDGEFDALVSDLVKALDKLQVRDPERGELLSTLGGMRPDIVNR